MRIFLFFCLLCVMISANANAQLKEFEHIYDIDLDEKIPLLWRVKKEYMKETSLYDWKYEYTWRIPSGFNYDFKQKIKYFGSVEKRIQNDDEESLLRDLKRMPKEYYPYIGPMLHNMKGLSGKILDMPGIKETKNKLPSKIASRLQDLPNLKFLSPELYIYLMPQIWGEDMDTLEFPHQKDSKPQDIPNIKINPEFIKNIKKKVPVSDYWLGAKTKSKKYDIRNYTADADTPLSNADVKAFINTLDGLFRFRLQKDYEIRNILVDQLIGFWEEKQGIDRNVSFLKTVVNPCQTIVRKIKWTGLRNEFQKVIGEQSFGLDDWAYTCEKTLKAYRVVDIPYGYTAMLKIVRKGYFYRLLERYYTPEEIQQIKYFIEATLHLYDTTPHDVEIVKKHKDQLFQKLLKFKNHFMGTPLIFP